MIRDPKYIANPSTRPVTMPSFIGPYTVVRRSTNGPYQLRDATDTLYPRQVHIDQMKVLFRANPRSDHTLAPAFGPSWVVEKIMSDRIEHEEQQYKVKWKDYPMSECTWEPVSNFDDIACIERYWKEKMLEEKKKRNGRAPRVSLLIYSQPSL